MLNNSSDKGRCLACTHVEVPLSMNPCHECGIFARNWHPMSALKRATQKARTERNIQKLEETINERLDRSKQNTQK